MASRRLGILALLTLFACADTGLDADRSAAGETLDAGEPASNEHGERPLEEALERWQRAFAGDYGEPLPEYTAKCDLATGIHVPDFKCSEGTLVPTTHLANGSCDRPNRLNRECDPGSRFQVVARSASAVAVAHCRKRGLPGNQYADIAIIQYNHVNGATCFYQALGTMDGDFKSPARGTSRTDQAEAPTSAASPWLSSSATHAIDCAGCHDNGALIRSPYITQLASMPGAGDSSYNSSAPVSFIGDDFQDWDLYSVKVQGNTCNGCHRLGIRSGSSRGGTAMDFGLRATARSEASKNPHSADSPIWMLPGQVVYSAAVEAQAEKIADCAGAWENGTALPSGCSVSRFSRAFSGLSPASAITTLF